MPAPALPLVPTEAALVGLSAALAGGDERGWSNAERKLLRSASPASRAVLREAQRLIEDGSDPLGEALIALRSREIRRAAGAVYTPPELVEVMTGWTRGRPVSRVVDPGAGSGRFLRAAGHEHPAAELVAVELDPLAALLVRANLAVVGFGPRLRVVVGDYRSAMLGRSPGPTLFLGNPPYVRHHGIDQGSKRWFSKVAAELGLPASQLAGLHAHFFLKTVQHARPGDFGAFVTSAEWLDVNWGRLMRALFLGPLGGIELHLLEPKLKPFADADTTAAITCFEVGASPSSVRLRRVTSFAKLSPLTGGRALPREALGTASRWSPLFRATRVRPRELVELGEIFEVHRGQVTGSNRVWIAGSHSGGLPKSVLFPAVTRARELFESGTVLRDASTLRSVIDLPVDLDELSVADRRAVERFLRKARTLGAHQGFIAEHRRAWWSVGLRAPAPILATYMARRPPAFVRNGASAHHINIAHGLYPRGPLSLKVLDAFARYLSRTTSLADGRTYAGGLTKFEPREMERLLVPRVEALLP